LIEEITAAIAGFDSALLFRAGMGRAASLLAAVLGRTHVEVERVAWHQEIERQPPLARPSVEVELMPIVVWARLQSSDEPVEVMANCFWKFAGEESPSAGLPEIGIEWLRERARQRAHCFLVCAWEAPV